MTSCSRGILSKYAKQLLRNDGVCALQLSRLISKSSVQSQEPEEKAPGQSLVNPLEYEDYFDVKKLVNLSHLFNDRCQYGHDERCRNPYMAPYLFGTRAGIDIIDLEKTVPLFQSALNIVAHIAYRGGVILFVSRQKATMHLVEETAKNCREFAHCRYWNPGLFTDSRNVFGHSARLPDLCVFLNTHNSVFRTHRAVTDCAKLLIPTVGVVDSNCDPRLITYPIPANDDSFTSIKHYLRLFEATIETAKQKRVEDGLADS